MTAFVYGSSEAATCMFACSRNAYHPLPDFVFELLPCNQVSADIGNLAVTWLNSGIRPLVRYRTDDIFELVNQCECGSGVAFRSYGRIAGKSPDDSYISDLENVLLNAAVPIYHYEFKIRPEGAALSLFVNDREHASGRDALLERIIGTIPDLHAAQIAVNPMDHLFLAPVTPPKLTRVKWEP